MVFYEEISTFDHECVIIIMKNKLMKEEILMVRRFGAVDLDR